MAISDPHSQADLSQGRIKHIDMNVKVDFQARALRIRAHYNLEKPAAGILSLDGRGLNIGRVFSTAGPIEYETGASDPILGERISIMLGEPTDAFIIELTTAPDAKALQWLDPNKTAGGRRPFLYSQCQPIHARSVFPCQDSPSVRFTYTAQLEVPKGLTAVMAAEHIGTHTQGDTDTYSFRMPQPIPSYLFALAVGDLHFKELGPRTGIYAEPQILDAAAWEFEENERRLTEAEKLFGPYLWDRYDLLIMPPSFPYGGMENPRLTFLTPLAVRGDRSHTYLVSHELAHAWLGNLVTNATWEDFWLNEGWTTYAQDRITELLEGADFAKLEFLLNREILREDMKTLGPDSNLTCLKTSMKGIDPDEVFSYVPYVKGDLLILSLERAVGREIFDAFMRGYIANHRFQSLTTDDFLAYLEQGLPAALEHLDIRQWLYEPGLPSPLPEVRSILYDSVSESIMSYGRGNLPDADQVRLWHPDQKELFLRLLPETIPSEHCRYLGGLFLLAGSRNKTLLFEYCRLCIRSEYRAILHEIKSFLAEVGNLYMLTRLFHCLVGTQWTRDMARPMFESARDRYHPITAAVIEKILAEARL